MDSPEDCEHVEILVENKVMELDESRCCHLAMCMCRPAIVAVHALQERVLRLVFNINS